MQRPPKEINDLAQTKANLNDKQRDFLKKINELLQSSKDVTPALILKALLEYYTVPSSFGRHTQLYLANEILKNDVPKLMDKQLNWLSFLTHLNNTLQQNPKYNRNGHFQNMWVAFFMACPKLCMECSTQLPSGHLLEAAKTAFANKLAQLRSIIEKMLASKQQELRSNGGYFSHHDSNFLAALAGQDESVANHITTMLIHSLKAQRYAAAQILRRIAKSGHIQLLITQMRDYLDHLSKLDKQLDLSIEPLLYILPKISLDARRDSIALEVHTLHTLMGKNSQLAPIYWLTLFQIGEIELSTVLDNVNIGRLCHDVNRIALEKAQTKKVLDFMSHALSISSSQPQMFSNDTQQNCYRFFVHTAKHFPELITPQIINILLERIHARASNSAEQMALIKIYQQCKRDMDTGFIKTLLVIVKDANFANHKPNIIVTAYQQLAKAYTSMQNQELRNEIQAQLQSAIKMNQHPVIKLGAVLATVELEKNKDKPDMDILDKLEQELLVTATGLTGLELKLFCEKYLNIFGATEALAPMIITLAENLQNLNASYYPTCKLIATYIRLLPEEKYFSFLKLLGERMSSNDQILLKLIIFQQDNIATYIRQPLADSYLRQLPEDIRNEVSKLRP